ncbi:MAG: aspartate/glutamate racemase family protein [Patescibacteria group bacterium]|nr:aspartate/glutamate racemase family protein [Patescibacteria group bacterium]
MIGIFDSGVGGLTVLRALREELPSADVVYFGDTKNAPYGERSREELSALTVAGLRLLQERGAERIVSACNSVSASLAVSLYDAFSLRHDQLIEMVGPTVSFFRGTTMRLAVCATPATVRSDIYGSAFRMIGKDVHSIAIPELAGAVESGAPEAEIKKIISGAFGGEKSFDVLILGCTHYPFASDVFRDVLGSSVTLFDPAEEVAQRAQKQFWPQEAGNGGTRFIISKDSERFRALAEELLPDEEYSVEVLE